MPAVTPALVSSGPSTTNMRLCRTSASGNAACNASQSSWCVVQDRASSSPASPATNAPAQTQATRRRFAAWGAQPADHGDSRLIVHVDDRRDASENDQRVLVEVFGQRFERDERHADRRDRRRLDAVETAFEERALRDPVRVAQRVRDACEIEQVDVRQDDEMDAHGDPASRDAQAAAARTASERARAIAVSTSTIVAKRSARTSSVRSRSSSALTTRPARVVIGHVIVASQT
jgi:hypothetical protein